MFDAAVRLAEPSDAASIVRLYAEAAAEWVVPRTALGCHGATAYVQSLIEERGRGWSSQFWVLGDDAFLQLRRVDVRTVMINNIFVGARVRGRGVGTELLRHALGEHPLLGHVVLDVFDDNPRARGWYEALGFAFTTGRTWLERPLPVATAAEYRVEGLPQADAVHHAFGFSMLQVETSAGGHSVGRLGSGWFRVPVPSALDDPGLVAALADLDPQRRVLALGQGNDDEQPWLRLGRSVRGQIQRAELLAALHTRRPDEER